MSMYRAIVCTGVLAGLLCAVAGAHAQQQAEPEAGLTLEQRERLAQQDEQMRQAGLQVMALVDANAIGQIWDGASQVMKELVPREEFVRQIEADRTRLGVVSGRSSPEITRSRSDGSDNVPEGLYINIAAMTRFADMPEPVRELVSFRFDEDQIWRVTGYSLR